MIILEALNYMGPNRRSQQTVLELLLQFKPDERETVISNIDNLTVRLQNSFPGFIPGKNTSASPSISEDALYRLGLIYGQLCIFLQQQAGHSVKQFGVLAGRDPFHWRYLIEREESDSAEKASDVALMAIAGLVPGLEWTSRTGLIAESTARLLRDYIDFAGPLALPADTLALVAAAKAKGIPVVKLERDPYAPVQAPHRIRMNSLLQLGHSRFMQIMDGTFCVSRNGNLLPLVHNPAARQQLLESLGFAAGGQTPAGLTAISVLIAGNKVLAVHDFDGNPAMLSEPTQHALNKLKRSIPSASLLVHFHLPDNGGAPAISDFSPAPEWDRFPGMTRALMDQLAQAVLEWMFPDPRQARIPTMVITGTNGKTTTTFMADQIMRAAGRRTGVASSNGIYINHKEVEYGDLAGLAGHLRVFESPDVDTAILETARGGVISRGFAFDRCDVAICLNVSDDHLGSQGVHTVEQMAEVKFSIVNTAGKAIVLNADDPWCTQMIGRCRNRKVLLVSMQRSHARLMQDYPTTFATCTLVPDAGKEWITLQSGAQMHRLIAADSIPATRGGHIQFNVDNAMHAAAACSLLGANKQTIVSALSAYTTNADTLLGRMNFLEGLPFEVVMDYSHNPDGFEKLATAVNNFEVPGRKRIVLGLSGDRPNQTLRESSLALLPVFEAFTLKDHPELRGRKPLEVPRLIREVLVKAGIEDTEIKLFDDELEAVRAGFESCEPGDLLVILISKTHLHEIWNLLNDLKRSYLNA